jgi:twitching motility protein PilT
MHCQPGDPRREEGPTIGGREVHTPERGDLEFDADEPTGAGGIEEAPAPPETPELSELDAFGGGLADTPPDPPASARPNIHRLPPQSAEAPPVAPAEAVRSPRRLVEDWLAGLVRAGASDLILRAGGRPSQRLAGRITFLPGRVPGPGPLLEVLDWLLGEQRMETWRETGSADASLQLDGLGRFRLNAYKQMGEPAIVIRRINEYAPYLGELNLPQPELERLAARKRGLVLVTGVAGSGKSTTLSGMIQHMNTTLERHVITLEDPVELLFREQECVISQREVGTDCPDFGDGLRHALRQSPDVILIGEMRDAETVTAALDATETGHLVFSTLHTVNGPQTVDRILSFYPSDQHSQVRARLADNVAGILSQRLIPLSGGEGLVPAYELLISTPHVRELLHGGKTAELARVIDMGTERGLISFNQCLKRLVLERKVDLKDAMAASDRPEELVLALRGITSSAGRPTRGPGSGKAGAGPTGHPGQGGPKGHGGPTSHGGPRGFGGRPGSDGLRMAGGE